VADTGADTDVVVELPATLRPELKDPLGPVFTDAEDLLAAASGPLVAVGDVVTYHLLEAGRPPDVALVDGRTERSPVDEEVEAAVGGSGGFDREATVTNPAATLTAGLLAAQAEAVDAVERGETTRLVVDGEEDLAALPAVLLAPRDGSVVYGQPGEGMVLVTVEEEVRERVRDLLERMDGDTGRLLELLGAGGS